MNDFEEAIKPYLALPEAQEYLALIQEYLATVKARNQALLDYTGLILNDQNLRSQISQRTAEANRIQSDLVIAQNPTIPEAQSIMATALSEIKMEIIKYIYKKHKSIDYWGVENNPFHIDSTRISTLSKGNGDLIDRELETLDRRNRAEQAFGPEFGALPVVISFASDPTKIGSKKDVFLTFRRTSNFVFEIPVDHNEFRGFAGVRLTSVDIKIDGIDTGDKRLVISLIHEGRSFIMNQERKIYFFSHRPRPSSIVYNLASGSPISSIAGNLGGDPGIYTYLSPFATWRLRIDPRDNTNPVLQNVTKITLSFSGKYLPIKA